MNLTPEDADGSISRKFGSRRLSVLNGFTSKAAIAISHFNKERCPAETKDWMECELAEGR